MKIIIIYHFKEKNQKRISFVKLLKENNPEFGLKEAKLNLDNMLDGKPIEYSIEEGNIENFIKKLDKLNLEYEIKLN